MVSLKNYNIIKNLHDFTKVYEEGKKWHCGGVVIFFLEHNDKKVGFVASKKVGKAHIRNAYKRILRAIFLQLQNELKDELENGFYILIAKKDLSEIKYKDLRKNVLWAFRKMQCIKS